MSTKEKKPSSNQDQKGSKMSQPQTSLMKDPKISKDPPSPRSMKTSSNLSPTSSKPHQRTSSSTSNALVIHTPTKRKTVRASNSNRKKVRVPVIQPITENEINKLEKAAVIKPPMSPNRTPDDQMVLFQDNAQKFNIKVVNVLAKLVPLSEIQQKILDQMETNRQEQREEMATLKKQLREEIATGQKQQREEMETLKKQLREEMETLQKLQREEMATFLKRMEDLFQEHSKEMKTFQQNLMDQVDQRVDQKIREKKEKLLPLLSTCFTKIQQEL